MVVHVHAVVDPVASSLAIRALDYELIQHVLDDLRHWTEVPAGPNHESAGRACLAPIGLRGPGMLEAVVAEIVLARQLDGPVEGGVADQADEITVRRRDVLESGELGRDFDDSAAATLRRW
jgi:hypothetical protein